MSRVRRLSGHRGTRGQNEEDEQKDEKEAMMRVRKSAEIAQADEMRSWSCVHDVVLSEMLKDETADIQFCYD